jgi:hypothetical protein
MKTVTNQRTVVQAALVRVCYEWQVNNLEFDSSAGKLSEQLSKIGLGYV